MTVDDVKIGRRSADRVKLDRVIGAKGLKNLKGEMMMQ